jgi:beta-glucosidase
MNKSIFIAIALFCTLTISAQKRIYQDVNQPIEKRVENALSLMTLEEKVGMIHGLTNASSKGVARLGIPEVLCVDGPMGIHEDDALGAPQTNDSCTAFPATIGLAATFNTELALLYGKVIGEEARYRNKTVLLAPGVGIYRTPLNGRNFECLGEDPYLASRIVVPYVIGLQQSSVAACVKVFVLNDQETYRTSTEVKISDRALYEIYLPGFKAAVQEAKAWSFMAAYNKFRGSYCSQSDLLLNQIVKKEWGFDGVIYSDWGGVNNLDEAQKNGLDLEMGVSRRAKADNGTKDHYYFGHRYLKGLKEGKYDVNLLNDKVSRILRMIFRTTMSANRPWGSFVTPEHSEAARKIGEEAIVLLKNDKQTLPIPVGKYKKIAVIGDNATKNLITGGGSSTLKAAYEVSPLVGLTNKYGKDAITYSAGYRTSPWTSGGDVELKINSDSLIQEAVETAKNAEVVLYVGGLNKNHYQDCEGGDRKSYGLPYGQEKLIKALLAVNKNIVVILYSGNAIEMPWLAQVPAVVEAWQLGSESGNALANVISGDVNPSGKLPCSWAKKLEDCAAHSFGVNSYPGDGKNQEYMEDILVGYRWFDTKKITPLFPFGYGLSYTTFVYGKISADKKQYSENETIKLSFTLKNTGKVDGAEAAQVYVSQTKASVARPAKELKAFKKVFLKAGEIQTVEMEVKVKDMAFFNDKTHSWEVEAGEFELCNAASAGDVKSKVSIQVK